MPVIPTEPSALQNIAAAANDIVERVRPILLSDENVERISGTLDDLDQITGTRRRRRRKTSPR